MQPSGAMPSDGELFLQSGDADTCPQFALHGTASQPIVQSQCGAGRYQLGAPRGAYCEADQHEGATAQNDRLSNNPTIRVANIIGDRFGDHHAGDGHHLSGPDHPAYVKGLSRLLIGMAGRDAEQHA